MRAATAATERRRFDRRRIRLSRRRRANRRGRREFRRARSAGVQLRQRVPGHPAWETGPHQKEEEFARSVSLALFDYLRKSRSQGFVVSLSGGADSSAVAVLVHLLVRIRRSRTWASTTLAEKLPHVKSLSTSAGDSDRKLGSADCSRASINRRATAAAQTLEAAQTVAEAVGAEFLEWNVDAMVDDYVTHRFARDRPRADLGARRRRAAEHSGPRARPGHLAAGESAQTRCCSRPATAARRPSATPRWTATRAAASRRSPASTRRSCSIGSSGWKRPARRASARCRRSRSSTTCSRPPSCARRRPTRPTKPTSCRTACWTRSSGPRSATSCCRSKSSKRCGRSFRSTTRSRWARGSSGSSGSGAATSGSASGTRRRSTWTMRISTRRPGAGSRFSTAGLSRSWRSCASMCCAE